MASQIRSIRFWSWHLEPGPQTNARFWSLTAFSGADGSPPAAGAEGALGSEGEESPPMPGTPGRDRLKSKPPPCEEEELVLPFAPVATALGNRMTLPFPEVLPILTPLFYLVESDEELEEKPILLRFLLIIII